MTTKQTKRDKQIQEIIKTINSNFAYSGVEYDYDKTHDGCNTDDYHRHCQIVDFEIRSIDLDYIARQFSYDVKKPILAYCLQRLPRLHSLFDEYRWDHSVSQGYYGEEIDWVKIDRADPIVDDVLRLFSQTDKQRVEFVLTKEYGYIADTIADAKDYEAITVPTSSIYIPNGDYQRHISSTDADIITDYKKSFDPNIPIGIYVQDGDRHRVTDGFHRGKAAIELAPENVMIIVKR